MRLPELGVLVSTHPFWRSVQLGLAVAARIQPKHVDDEPPVDKAAQGGAPPELRPAGPGRALTPHLAGATMTGAFNLGHTRGPWLGGTVTDAELGFRDDGVGGASMTVLALVAAFFSLPLRPGQGAPSCPAASANSTADVAGPRPAAADAAEKALTAHAPPAGSASASPECRERLRLEAGDDGGAEDGQTGPVADDRARRVLGQARGRGLRQVEHRPAAPTRAVGKPDRVGVDCPASASRRSPSVRPTTAIPPPRTAVTPKGRQGSPAPRPCATASRRNGLPAPSSTRSAAASDRSAFEI
ncbi:hypothetical protein [Streptomyces sp. CB02115]|uniref:hypothetical protein n=1 Tax=Streptomyces sp. CB02115 TaxID=1703939 RepID=UPI00093CECC6|nr:hypothetical protein [Streptomyces sp. CB02115]OKJ51688.1 hypothetical protein AMK28_25170 [Streptomyces sp. CB02115]